MAKATVEIVLVLLASSIMAGALKVRKIPPADGGQCSMPDAKGDGDGGGGETCGGSPGEPAGQQYSFIFYNVCNG